MKRLTRRSSAKPEALCRLWLASVLTTLAVEASGFDDGGFGEHCAVDGLEPFRAFGT